MSGFDDWIGYQRSATDTVTERLVQQFRVTLDGTLCAGPHLPGMHWCLAPDTFPPADLGRDGHPKTGLLLPDLGLRRRMWAGGHLAFTGGIGRGKTVKRISTIRDIRFKQGRSGKLGFVTLDHVYKVDGETRITEEQNIVYRDDPDPNATRVSPAVAAIWTPVRATEITPTPTLLFRYSALTFNGHRIHYDFPYATGVEGYAGLVVHGPMQSTWMQHMATDILGRLPGNFTYRGIAPLICGRPAMIEARENGERLDLRVRDVGANVVTMEARAN